MKLDIKDLKILAEIDKRSRQSYHEIGRKVGLSKDVVINRIKRFMDEKLIHLFHTMIDVSKLGYISFRVYIKFQNTSLEKEKEIIDFFVKEKHVAWVISIEGKYDLGICVVAKDVQEMNLIWNSFKEKYAGHVTDYEFAIFSKVTYFSRGYILREAGLKDKSHEYIFNSLDGIAPHDNTDLKILQLLAPDSRMSLVDLANSLGLSPKTLSMRIKSLEKRKIIVGYRSFFDIGKLGYKYFKLHFSVTNITKEKDMQFRQFVREHPNIIFMDDVLGGDFYEIEVQVKSIGELQRIIKEIKGNFYDIIREHWYMWFYKEHKFVLFPPE